MVVMRAKMRVSNIVATESSERVYFSAVAKNDGYPKDGSDEDNTFAKWSPNANAEFYIVNPALFGKFNINDKFYVDFTSV